MAQHGSLIDWRDEAAWLRDLGRAFGGALLFGLPLLMTVEMWDAGITMSPEKQLAFLAFGVPLLWGLAYYAGFSARRGVVSDGLDVLTALAVGFITALILLVLFGIVRWADTADAVAGRVLIQAAPSAMGALLARRQLAGAGGDGDGGGDEDQASYLGELFLMAAGALFLALNMAPTEEVELIAYKASPLHILGLMALSLILMHAIVYAAGFAGQEEHGKPVTAFFHFTLPGYAVALTTGLFVLWVFGRIGDQGLAELTAVVIVLGLPAAIGAAAARLLV